MKKHIALALLLSASLLLSGCIDIESVVTVKKDGSGTIEENTLVSAQFAAMMAMAASGLGGQQPGGAGGAAPAMPNVLMTDEQAKAKAGQMGPGVTVQSIEALKSPDGRQGQKVVYAFADISKVKFEPGDMNAAGAAGATGAAANTPMTFTLSNGTLTVKNGSAKAAASAPPLPGTPAPTAPPTAGATPLPSPQEMAMMKSMFAGMRMALRVKSVSGIASTDATYVDGDTVTLMDIQMDKLFDNPAVLEKLSGLQNNPNMSPAAASEALKGIDGVKAESKDTVTIKLK